jgi:hypothetical protein
MTSHKNDSSVKSTRTYKGPVTRSPQSRYDQILLLDFGSLMPGLIYTEYGLPQINRPHIPPSSTTATLEDIRGRPIRVTHGQIIK